MKRIISGVVTGWCGYSRDFGQCWSGFVKQNSGPVGGAGNSGGAISEGVSEVYAIAHRSISITALHGVGCGPACITRYSGNRCTITRNEHGGCLDIFVSVDSQGDSVTNPSNSVIIVIGENG